MKKNITRLHTHFLGLAGITGITASIFSLGLIAKTQGFCTSFSLGLIAKTQGFCTSSSFRIEKKRNP